MVRNIRRIEHSMPMIPVKKRVAAYARVSSGKDAMLHSLSAQVSYYNNYIQRHPGWVYVGVYADEAITGTKDDRVEFQRLLADCRAGKIDMIITKSISRFARNTVTMLETVRELKSLGIDVYFEKENIHSLSGDGELMLTILASFAQEESRSVSENCKWRIRKRFQDGELVNLRFMYGYRITKGRVDIDLKQAAAVRMIFDEYIKGVGCIQITQQLRESGVDGYHSGSWTPKRILRILKNEKYSGNALLQKKYVADHLSKTLITNHGVLPKYYAENTHPPIIDAETFQKARRVMEENRIKSNIARKAPARYPFTGMIVCGLCGKRYKRKASRYEVAWNCSTYLQKGKSACHAKKIPESILLSLTADALELPEFNGTIFKKSITEIQVPGFNKVVFLFSDGRKVAREWRDKSRRDSWTNEMRRRARDRAIAQRRCGR